MKYEETQKITALGVVIFSFIALLLCLIIVAAVDSLTALLVLKTPLPEHILKVGSVLGSGFGLILSTALLTAKGRMKGIVASAIMAAFIVAIKIIGNTVMGMGGYFTWMGFAGILFTIVFSFVGGILGTVLKKR